MNGGAVKDHRGGISLNVILTGQKDRQTMINTACRRAPVSNRGRARAHRAAEAVVDGAVQRAELHLTGQLD